MSDEPKPDLILETLTAYQRGEALATAAEYREMLREAGFADSRCTALPDSAHQVVIGDRSA